MPVSCDQRVAPRNGVWVIPHIFEIVVVQHVDAVRVTLCERAWVVDPIHVDVARKQAALTRLDKDFHLPVIVPALDCRQELVSATAIEPKSHIAPKRVVNQRLELRIGDRGVFNPLPSLLTLNITIAFTSPMRSSSDLIRLQQSSRVS